VGWRPNNLESLKKSLMKAAAEIYFETVRAAIAEWLECPKVCTEADGAILSDITWCIQVVRSPNFFLGNGSR